LRIRRRAYHRWGSRTSRRAVPLSARRHHTASSNRINSNFLISIFEEVTLMNGFQDKLAVVFGGGRDIGGAIAIELAQRGAQVALSYHGSDPSAVVDTITKLRHRPFVQKVDATDTAVVRQLAE